MGEENILIIKKKSPGNKVSAKVRRKITRGFSPDSYVKTFNPVDPNDMATLFEDLNLLFNTPIEKSFRLYHEKKNKGFPF